MRKLLNRSFRSRLFAAFLAVSLVPLLVCSAMLLQIFRLRMTNDARQSSQEHLNNVIKAMDAVFEDCARAVVRLQGDPVLAGALTGGGVNTQVYSALFDAIGPVRSYARFDLYDLEGNWRCSTQQAPLQVHLPTNWGVLYAAAHAEEPIAYVACEDVTQTGAPLLQGAALLLDGSGQRVGYLVISMYQSDFRQMLEGKYGSQNDLVLLSRYWRPVYCAQPTLADALAQKLRGQLLSGQALNEVSEEFEYSVAYHQGSGLYLVLQQPQVFTRDTMRLLYTVSVSSALICVAISVVMSLKVSRQMFRPIERLHQGIGEVVQNNLDVYVPPVRDDELGQLAQRFNGMVVALKHNQEQLVENQRELNQAQIRMLQAQLNPHFLCNTLDTMKWISKINQVPQVALMSTNLADILRFCISPDEFVTLDREVEILQRYIEIQKIRLSGAFSFAVRLPVELEDCLVPKMILQPLVENAILHGLDGVENGAIEVEARKTQDGMLRITVTDNGLGLQEDMKGAYRCRDRERSKGHLGLYNVDTILTKYYGEGCGLYLDNVPGGRGAVVAAVLPIRREDEAQC